MLLARTRAIGGNGLPRNESREMVQRAPSSGERVARALPTVVVNVSRTRARDTRGEGATP
jgi:hypothetical protein